MLKVSRKSWESPIVNGGEVEDWGKGKLGSEFWYWAAKEDFCSGEEDCERRDSQHFRDAWRSSELRSLHGSSLSRHLSQFSLSGPKQ